MSVTIVAVSFLVAVVCYIHFDSVNLCCVVLCCITLYIVAFFSLKCLIVCVYAMAVYLVSSVHF